MVNFRRNKTGNPDEVYFLTIVTYNRSKWIEEWNAYYEIENEMKRLLKLLNYKYKAWVVLPEHIHWLIKPGDKDYSNIVSAFKRGIGAEMKRREKLSQGGKLWQARFWEETIRDHNHYRKCVEYIHHNPVKHGLSGSPSDWRHSSFRSYVKRGLYPGNWASGENIEIRGSEYD